MQRVWKERIKHDLKDGCCWRQQKNENLNQSILFEGLNSHGAKELFSMLRPNIFVHVMYQFFIFYKHNNLTLVFHLSLLRYRAPWFSERVTLETSSTVTLKPESSEKPNMTRGTIRSLFHKTFSIGPGLHIKPNCT